ncbi:Uncharacterised protein [Mycobacteroides abscessus]|nr:Uncharacterised protein [Mycobacteroides abscessus]SKU10029.1 Uncharacterised protein [Mycobacteroides abscessus subsp. abscessus]
MVVDGFGIARFAVPEALDHPPPTGQGLLWRRGDGAQMLKSYRSDDIGQHPCRWALEVQPLGHGLQQLVGVSGVYPLHFDITGDICACQP